MIQKISLAQVAKLVVLSLYLLLIVVFGQNNVQIDQINNQNELGNVTKQTKFKKWKLLKILQMSKKKYLALELIKLTSC